MEKEGLLFPVSQRSVSRAIQGGRARTGGGGAVLEAGKPAVLLVVGSSSSQDSHQHDPLDSLRAPLSLRDPFVSGAAVCVRLPGGAAASSSIIPLILSAATSSSHAFQPDFVERTHSCYIYSSASPVRSSSVPPVGGRTGVPPDRCVGHLSLGIQPF